MKTISFNLSDENIERYVRLVYEFGQKNSADKKRITDTCSALEAIMRNDQSHFGVEQSVDLIIKKRFGEVIITLNLVGESYTPYGCDVTDENHAIQAALGLAPRYNYSYGRNRVTLILECNKSRRDLFVILFSVALGLVIGLGGMYMPDVVLEPCHILSSAISNAIFGLMGMAALPVIFLCVVLGILGTGSIKVFKESGFHILKKQIVSMIGMLLFTTVLCVLLFDIKISSSSSEIEFVQTFVDTLFSIVPNNFIAPFVESDNVKVIVIGILIGCALLALEEKVSLIHELVIQLKEVCSLILTWVGKLIPLLIVVLLVDNIWSGNFGIEILSMWRIAAVYMLVLVLVLSHMILRVSHEQKVGFGKVFSAVITPGIKGIASGSTMLCYYDMIDGLKNKLKIPESKTNFGIPLGIAFFQPSALQLGTIVLFFVSACGIDVDMAWMISFFLITYVTSISTPPVTGGVVSLLAILFTTLSINDPMTAVAFPLIMLLDYPGTGFRVMAMMLNVAKK